MNKTLKFIIRLCLCCVFLLAGCVNDKKPTEDKQTITSSTVLTTAPLTSNIPVVKKDPFQDEREKILIVAEDYLKIWEDDDGPLYVEKKLYLLIDKNDTAIGGYYDLIRTDGKCGRGFIEVRRQKDRKEWSVLMASQDHPFMYTEEYTVGAIGESIIDEENSLIINQNFDWPMQ